MSQVKVLMVRLVDLIILSVVLLVAFTILEDCQQLLMMIDVQESHGRC